MLEWLRWESARRGYRKPVLISDTATNPWVAWGVATYCDWPPARMGVIIPPATEADRCRLAAYFTRLVNGDPATVRWTQEYAAADNVKRVVIAAEQGVVLINTAFAEDLSWFKLKPLGAGTGPSAWAGLVDLDRRERRAGYHALRQLLTHLAGYSSIARLPHPDPAVRIYELRSPAGSRWIAWYEPDRVVLPGDPVPTLPVELPVGVLPVQVEPMRRSDTAAAPPVLRPTDGRLAVTLTPVPLFLSVSR
jgi:hypothetical protein